MVSTRGTIGAPRRWKLFLCAALFAAGFMTPVHAIDYPQDQKKALTEISLDELTDDFLEVALNWQGQLIKFDEPRKLGVSVIATGVKMGPGKRFWRANRSPAEAEHQATEILTRLSRELEKETGLVFQEAKNDDGYLRLNLSATPYTLRYDYLSKNPALYEFREEGAITIGRHRYSNLSYGLQRPCGNYHDDACYKCAERIATFSQDSFEIATTNFAKECGARSEGFVRVLEGVSEPIGASCVLMMDVEAGLISFQVADCLLRAAGLTGESPLFPSAVVGEHLPKQRHYFIGEGESISRPDYVARMPAELTVVDRLYLATLYDPRLKSGQTREEARPIARRILAEKLAAMRPR